MAGKLEVITGPMFAGKTEELLRRVERHRIAGRKVLVFKPEIDTRSSPKEISSHAGKKWKAKSLPVSITWEEFFKNYPQVNSAEVVAFDEVQFFAESFIQIVLRLIRKGKIVIVSGLNLDFRGKPFGIMPFLLSFADEITVLTAICTAKTHDGKICGKAATKSQRILDNTPVTSGPTVLVGGKEKYEPRCNEHFVFSD